MVVYYMPPEHTLHHDNEQSEFHKASLSRRNERSKMAIIYSFYSESESKQLALAELRKIKEAMDHK